MIIEDRAQYEEIPDGAICRVYLTGDEWRDERREQKCVKVGVRLYPISNGFYDFTERNDGDDLDFIVCHFEKDDLHNLFACQKKEEIEYGSC